MSKSDTFQNVHGHDVPKSIYDAKDEKVDAKDSAYGFRASDSVQKKAFPVKVNYPPKGDPAVSGAGAGGEVGAD